MLNVRHEESAHIDIAPVDRVLDTALDTLFGNYLHDTYLHIVELVLLRCFDDQNMLKK